ncbi:MAG: hypothetical protein Alpg2KO_00180 [Alphaproteobacteria bacterium]
MIEHWLVPHEAEEYVALLVTTLLNHFWTAQLSEAEQAALYTDWLNAVADQPLWAIEAGRAGLLNRPAKSRVTPGDLLTSMHKVLLPLLHLHRRCDAITTHARRRAEMEKMRAARELGDDSSTATQTSCTQKHSGKNSHSR